MTTALIEAATGVALMLVPGMVLALLIGTIVDTAGGLVVARVAGIAMLSIAIACWTMRNDAGDASRGLLLALLFYTSAVALLLVHAAVSFHLTAVGLWPTVGAHAVMAAWCVSCRVR
jgi:hypothetical protein